MKKRFFLFIFFLFASLSGFSQTGNDLLKNIKEFVSNNIAIQKKNKDYQDTIKMLELSLKTIKNKLAKASDSIIMLNKINYSDEVSRIDQSKKSVDKEIEFYEDSLKTYQDLVGNTEQNIGKNLDKKNEIDTLNKRLDSEYDLILIKIDKMREAQIKQISLLNSDSIRTHNQKLRKILINKFNNLVDSVSLIVEYNQKSIEFIEKKREDIVRLELLDKDTAELKSTASYRLYGEMFTKSLSFFKKAVNKSDCEKFALQIENYIKESKEISKEQIKALQDQINKLNKYCEINNICRKNIEENKYDFLYNNLSDQYYEKSNSVLKILMNNSEVMSYPFLKSLLDETLQMVKNKKSVDSNPFPNCQ